MIRAQKEKEVEELSAAKHLAVAQLNKQQAETLAQQELEVAKLDLLKAKEMAEAQIVLASARQKSLSMGGAISEKERILAQIEKEKAIGVAEQLAKIAVPKIVMGRDGRGGDQESLLNMFLLKKLGILPDDEVKR